MLEIVSTERGIEEAGALHVYESDELTAYRRGQMVVVLPGNTPLVSTI